MYCYRPEKLLNAWGQCPLKSVSKLFTGYSLYRWLVRPITEVSNYHSLLVIVTNAVAYQSSTYLATCYHECDVLQRIDIDTAEIIG